MNLNDTKMGKKHSLIELGEGIYVKAMPMAKMQAYFKQLSGGLKDESKSEDIINEMFDRMVVDKDGKQFENLVGKKATDELDVFTITEIMEKIPKVVIPNAKQ